MPKAPKWNGKLHRQPSSARACSREASNGLKFSASVGRTRPAQSHHRDAEGAGPGSGEVALHSHPSWACGRSPGWSGEYADMVLGLQSNEVSGFEEHPPPPDSSPISSQVSSRQRNGNGTQRPSSSGSKLGSGSHLPSRKYWGASVQAGTGKPYRWHRYSAAPAYIAQDSLQSPGGGGTEKHSTSRCLKMPCRNAP